MRYGPLQLDVQNSKEDPEFRWHYFNKNISNDIPKSKNRFGEISQSLTTCTISIRFR